MQTLRRLAIPCAPIVLAGCLSGLGPGEPQDIRYFSAEAPAVVAVPKSGDAPLLRLRRTSAASHLRERMVWRVSDVEYGFYETRRWTELPVTWLERSLGRQLFEGTDLRRTQALTAPALDVHLTAFEEQIRPEHQVRAAVSVHLFSPSGEALIEGSFERTQEVGGGDPAEVAQAISLALAAVVREVAEAIAPAVGESSR